uniref:EF-hand calcium binding domain 5 n=1 Tax=Anolis carolinensis TaxID=28377 RepID=H9GIF2_ANOCA|nr:PREDICTED: EF-hand calcium-binding domain-containing protein 5 [Anolis carolinensis]XP_008118544.1 PREDICTED: EF-hand calcium-binding domain-containing protein 5 [Anolis carolinensis]XP_016852772.1 PREDICTED: EF-hand calcium-binding domain-containing protein 5 [Anolis carolinensis]|eukprot:XP_008118543.1 PREDICTED: EF-hand calcium-binding domain-containing protein 5 [Anolis carolinensis]
MAESERTEEESERSTLRDLPSEMESLLPPSAVRPLSPQTDARWKAVFYKSVQSRALDLQERRVAKFNQEKALEKKTERKEPPDALAREWFDDERAALETRAYLLDKLLPTLVPGVEKLLRVAERKKALEKLEPRKFDPITFLGEYLMRNNPAFQLSATLDPYQRGVKAVTEELKTKVPKTTQHKLAEMKALVEERRHEREEVDKIKDHVKDIRRRALGMQFREWTQDITGRIPLELIQSALRSFLEVMRLVPEAGSYARPLEAVGTLEVKVNEEECIEYLLSYVKNFNSDQFEQLLRHLLQCANDARDAIRHDVWRQMFVQLFLDCDHGQVGLLDRARVFSLLKYYYDNCLRDARKGYRDPRKWPMAELEDIELMEFWGNMEDDEPIVTTAVVSEESLPGLSAEALVLNNVLKDILSDMEVGKVQDTLEDQAAAIPEQDGQVTITVEDESQVVPVTEQAEQTTQEVTVPEEGSPEKVEVTVPEEGSPEKVEVSVPAEGSPEKVEETVLEEGSPEKVEVAVPEEGSLEKVEPTAEDTGTVDEGVEPETIPEMPPELLVEEKEADEGERPEKLSPPPASEPVEMPAPTPSLSQTATNLQQVLDQELGPDVEGTSTDQVPGVQDAGVEEAAAKEEEHGEKTDAGEVEEQRPASIVEPPSQSSGEQATGLLLSPAKQPSKEAKREVQLIYGEPWSGDFRAADLSFKYADYGKEIREDWNNENSRFPDLRMNMVEIQARGPPSSISTFEKDFLDLPQFVQLLETFVGEETSLPNLKKMVEFVKGGYVQTEREKIKQLEQIHHRSFLVWKQLLLAALFEKWDNECSGFLDMKEVDAVLATFKEGMEEEALNKAKLQLPIPQWHPSGIVKLSCKDFQTYMELVVSELTGNEDEVLDSLVEFLMMAVDWTHLERLRGSARRKWLLGIAQTAKVSGGCMEPVYQALFKTLSRDADAHGKNKRISAYVALLEYNLINPTRGDILLRYVACTEDDAPYVLNKPLFMDMKGISFAAALQDKPIHVPRVQLHGNIHFWNCDRLPKDRTGSFLVLPLEDIRRRVFGVLGLDTLRDKSDQTIFVPHEIRFYQGAANTFSVSYHHIRTQDCLKQVIISAVGWISTQTTRLQSITAYFMEPGENRMQDYTLRKVMTSDLKETNELHPSPAPVLSRKDDFFSGFLFRCIDCSMVVMASTNEEHHIAVPLRNPEGQAIAVLDINLGRWPKLPSCEHKDLQKMLKMTQAATYEILKEDAGDLEPYYILEAEYVGDWRRGGVLFYRFLLQDLQNCIWNLDPWDSFSDIRCFEQPPLLVHTILKCTLLVLNPQWAGTEAVENWDRCIQKFDGELIENICYFDPTAAYVETTPEVIYNSLQGTQRYAVWRFGSAPLEYLYNWIHACLALIEMAKKLKHQPRSAFPSSSVLLTPALSRSLRSSQISTYGTISLN